MSDLSYEPFAVSLLGDYAKSIQHHMANAKRHAGNEQWEYAAGSMRKAQKWIARAEALVAYQNSFPGVLLRIVGKRIAEDMEHIILYGK